MISANVVNKNFILRLALMGEDFAVQTLFELLTPQWRHMARMKHGYSVLCADELESIARYTLLTSLARMDRAKKPCYLDFANYFGRAFEKELGNELRREVVYRNACQPLGEDVTDAEPQDLWQCENYERLKARLTDKQWRAVELHYLKGWDEKRTALEMDCSERQVRRYLSAARRLLQDLR